MPKKDGTQTKRERQQAALRKLPRLTDEELRRPQLQPEPEEVSLEARKLGQCAACGKLIEIDQRIHWLHALTGIARHASCPVSPAYLEEHLAPLRALARQRRADILVAKLREVAKLAQRNPQIRAWLLHQLREPDEGFGCYEEPEPLPTNVIQLRRAD